MIRLTEYYLAESDTPLMEKLTDAEILEIEEDCLAYTQSVESAVKMAYKVFIEKHSKRNALYSRTWK